MKQNHHLTSMGLLCGLMFGGNLIMTSCNSKAAAPTAEQEDLMPYTHVLNDGKTTVTWIKDNQGHAMREASLFAEATNEVIEELGLQGGIPSTVSVFLLHADGEWILFDTGLGIGKGLLVNTLDSLGVPADSISEIYLTHFHGDHIGGMVYEGKPVFKNAEVYAGQREYDAWINEMPRERTQMQQEAMTVYNEHLHLFQFGDTLAHGIVALDAVGHTPGHTAFQKENLLVIGDLMHGAALQIPHPEYCARYDMDPAKSIEARVRIMKYAKDNHLLMAGMHLAEPAFIESE